MALLENKAKTESFDNSDTQEEISGIVENIVFRAEDTGYTVFSINISGQRNKTIIVGNCAAIWVGETIKAIGQWIHHKQHGYQFKASSISCFAPTTNAGIERYLASGMIRGVGKVMAERIMKAFGTDALRIIDKESERLLEVEGIGAVRRKMVKESWNEQKAVRDIMIFLHSHGVGTAQSVRIFKEYGNDAIGVITENPYCLCKDVWGIGFKTADSVALSIGIPEQSKIRACAGIVHVLQTMAGEGHCYCEADELILQSQSLLKIQKDILEQALECEVKSGRLIDDRGLIYLVSLYNVEISIAEKIRRLQNTLCLFKPIIIDKAIPWAEERMEITFAPMQVEALKMALSEKISIITGGPGVGKTTIIRALVDVFKAKRLTVSMAAPTGRAAKRMEESTNHEASTIHRVLKFMPRTGQFLHGADNPVESDIFILDETSMIDAPLMSVFLEALPDESCLILIGDVDQLPSVGPGNVLRDLINSEVIPYRKLETIYRQKTGSGIIQNAHRVNRGESLLISKHKDCSDFYFINAIDPDQVIDNMLNLITTRIPSRFGYDPMDDIQILTPMRRNQLGTENLNAVLQEALNPAGPEFMRFGKIYRLGDRVMQIRNNYDKNIYNGDIGRIIRIDKMEQHLVVDFDKFEVLYDLTELDELIHAYACSIHKSQGSEYPAVIILMTTQHYRLLQRNLLYTALTRGKELVCLIGSKKAVNMAIRNNEIHYRKTGLKVRLTGSQP